MSWPLLKPGENSEDDDSDFNISSYESADEEENRPRQEYDMNRTRIPFKRQKFEFVKLFKICFII